MKIEIDQSGKIEQTNKDTIIGFSNGIFGSILIRAKTKREIERIFRQAGKSKVFVYKVFAILIFLLIKRHLNKIEQIIIDEEYPGKEALIKSFLLREIRKVQPDFAATNIMFREIGKKSKAHYVAYGVKISKRAPDRTVESREMLKLLIK